ncbi:MAG: hypothetical protein AABY91_03555, partial [Gemmatimonadota bacterium]
ALGGLLLAWGGLRAFPALGTLPAALTGLSLFGAGYLGLTALLGVPQVGELVRRLGSVRENE